MPAGGVLRVGVGEEEVSAERMKSQLDARAGRFVRLVVSDTGHGMDSSTLKQLFEPFFSTKDVVQGVGLSLATVRGIVRQHRGWVEVGSTPGSGSTFRVYLPVETRKAEAAIRAELGTGVARGSRTVLLVKDDASLRQATRAVLNRLGYQVLEAADGEEALAVWAARRAEIDLVLADMVMPGGLSGLDVARQAMAEKPGVPVIITSSYHTARSELEKRGGAGVIYLPKPCPMQELVGALERCLGGKEEGKAESGKQKVEISP